MVSPQRPRGGVWLWRLPMALAVTGGAGSEVDWIKRRTHSARGEVADVNCSRRCTLHGVTPNRSATVDYCVALARPVADE